ncbi:MAG: L-threonylcarbamoyladenylate synthase [Planctomycetota bacterium]
MPPGEIPQPPILAAADELRRGRLVVFPTETVYGLGADALNADAVAAVFERKGRPSGNPLIVHVSGTEMARGIVAEWPPLADRLAAEFWPGPLTIVLARGDTIPDAVSAGGPTVAVRCPDHPLTRPLIDALGRPIVGPSANPSGTLSPTTADHVRAWLGDSVMILDGGPCERGIESTVVSVDGGTIRVLRPGVVTPGSLARFATVEAYENAAGSLASPPPAETVPLRSPGLLRQHYAPRTRLRLFESADRRAVLDRLHAAGSSLVVLSHGIRLEDPRIIRMPPDPHTYARELYAAMHRADAFGADAILAELPEGGDPVWLAIRDRLLRAAAH